MDQIASQIFGPVVNILTGHITKHLGYVTSSTKHVNNMRRKMKILEDKKKEFIEHMERNKINNKEIPARVRDWLVEVETVNNQVKGVSSNGIGCLNMKKRYHVGRNALKTINDIESLTSEDIVWSDANIPLGRVASKLASATSPSHEHTQNDFISRNEAFKDALKFLQQDEKASQVIALCGMGGVGKTTMMEQLRKVAHDNNMFHLIVKVVIGRNPNILSIQNDIAVYTGEALSEGSKTIKADYLCKRFEKLLQDKKKILVILDDVWEKIELKDIGLTCPLPDGIKLLLTSRLPNICTQIAAYADSILQVVTVNVLGEAEAQKFFFHTAGVSEEDDHYKHQIGCDIVKKCGCLPLAIKLIASTLKAQDDCVWRDTLNRLKNNDLDDNVQEIIKISYEYIKDDKEILLLCALFPEDSDVPIEDLTRHAWGLKLLKNVSTLREARDRTNTSAHNLINANLLISSERVGCVKMHDLVLAFVLGMVSKGVPVSIINHGDASKWRRDEMSESCKRISLTCMGMSEFPSDFKYPNLSLLQLMHGDLSFFPEDFYKNMENLKVIAYYEVYYPLLPRSFQSSTNLKTLCLHKCKLTSDCTFVGDLVNLEVLSFAHCSGCKLPSTIQNLVKLKLLDLTGCVGLDIEDGVFQKLASLEELYMGDYAGECIRFTDATREELAMLSRQLSTLVIEFIEKKTQLKNVSFQKLDRFKLSIGCHLDKDNYLFRNTLKLVTNSSNDLLDCKISEVFRKTEKLHLHVKHMFRLEDIISIHPFNEHSFCYLRDLEVSDCVDLKYLFPIQVATGLTQLECLKISKCFVLEALVHDDGMEIKRADKMIKFKKLKFISLKWLLNLVDLFLVDNVVELPQLVELELEGLPSFTSIYPDENNLSSLQQPIFNSKVKISKLEKLKIKSMKKLKQIWACSSGEEVNDIHMVKEIEVWECDGLVNMFPVNPMRLLSYLEVLTVIRCGSIEEIFNIDMELGCVGEIAKVSSSINKSSSLRSINVYDLEKLSGVWRIKGAENNSGSIFISGIEDIESIKIKYCKMFKNVFTSSNTNMVDTEIQDWEGSLKNKELVKNNRQNEQSKEGDDNICAVAFPSNSMQSFSYLHKLHIRDCDGVEVVFEIGCEETSSNNRPPFLPKLQKLKLYHMQNMSRIWKCNNWNNFLNLHKRHPQTSFHNLTTIWLIECKNIKYLFSPLVAQLLLNLKELRIEWCEGIEEVVSNRHDREIATSTYAASLFPHLQLLEFKNLPNLKHVGGGVHDQFKVGFVSWSLCQYSIEIDISGCNALSSVIPSYAVGQMQKLQVLSVSECNSLIDVFETQDGNMTNNSNWNNSFHNLTNISLEYCKNIKYLFSPLVAQLLLNLKELSIDRCEDIEEVVSNRHDKEVATSTYAASLFPHLQLLNFRSLPKLKHVGGGVHDQFKVGVVSWSLCQYSIGIDIYECNALSSVIPSYAVGQMQKLQVLSVSECNSLIEVFETQDGNMTNNNNGGTYEGNNNDGKADATLLLAINPRQENISMSKYLRKLVITKCNLLPYVFTFSILASLGQLKELIIRECEAMKVIVKEEKGAQNEVVEFPHLETLELSELPNLVGFFLGTNDFQWPVLKNVTIDECPQMMVFACGNSRTPQLKYIHTSLGKHSTLDCGLNFHVKKTHLHQTFLPSPESRISHSPTLEQLPWSFCNLIEFAPKSNDLKFIPANELLQLQSLEKINVRYSRHPALFEELPMNETEKVIEFPKLREVQIKKNFHAHYLWKSNPRRTVLKFPNLTTLSLKYCSAIGHVFTSSMVDSLLQLRDLDINRCECLEVLVKVDEEEDEDGGKDEEEEEEDKDEDKEEGCDAKVKEIVLPRLESLKLGYLDSLKGFCLGNDSFSFPSLKTLEIKDCSNIMVFTNGHVATPALKIINTSFGKCYVREDLNSFIKTKQCEGFRF